MKARCGLEDCDCEYTIDKLVTALEEALNPLSYDGSIVEWKKHTSALITKVEEERPR